MRIALWVDPQSKLILFRNSSDDWDIIKTVAFLLQRTFKKHAIVLREALANREQKEGSLVLWNAQKRFRSSILL
jgi:hypothetical protein